MTEMNENKNENDILDLNHEMPARTPSRLPFYVGVLVVLGLVVAGFQYIEANPSALLSLPVGAQASSADPAQVAALEARIKALEAKLDSGALAAPSAKVGPDQDDMQKLKENLAGLSAALGGLETQIQKTAETTQTVQQDAKANVASVMAYFRLYTASRGGEAFEGERQAMRRAISDDQAVIDLLIKLEPLALTGVPTIGALQAEWQQRAPEAEAALRKAAAKTWQDRIIVALESLVSIRTLGGESSTSLSFAAIEADLAQGRLAAALEKLAALSKDAQAMMEPWRKKAAKRLEAETLIAQIADQMGGPQTPVAPAASEPAVQVPSIQAPGSEPTAPVPVVPVPEKQPEVKPTEPPKTETKP